MKTKITIIILLITTATLQAQMKFNFDGETLQYNAKYGFIKGGEVKITAKKITYNNTECYDVAIDMYAIGIVNKIFNFHDIFSSVFSVKTLKPYKFIRDAHEGKYEEYEVVTYHDNYVESSIKGRFDTKERFYDVVSGIFAVRSHDWSHMENGDTLTLPIYFDEQIFNAKIVYKGKEKVKLNNKQYNCVRFKPIFDGVKMFSKKGIDIYFSNDFRRKPVLIDVHFNVGSFKVELVE